MPTTSCTRKYTYIRQICLPLTHINFRQPSEIDYIFFARLLHVIVPKSTWMQTANTCIAITPVQRGVHYLHQSQSPDIFAWGTSKLVAGYLILHAPLSWRNFLTFISSIIRLICSQRHSCYISPNGTPYH